MADGERDQPDSAGRQAVPAADVDPNLLAVATDEQLEAIFQRSTTLPIDHFVNAGGHRVDLASRTIFNDEHWKGYLPVGPPPREVFARLRTGYAKRFWKKGDRFLGETRYVEGRILVKHALEEITLDQVSNDLAPGRYIILHYTDLVFEHIFYDAMKALDDNVIVYRGYAGRYPHGKRGFTGVLMRGFTFAQMGVRDHKEMFQTASAPSVDALTGTWRLQVIDTSDHPADLARVSFERTADGRSASTSGADTTGQSMLVPPFVLDHFTGRDAAALASELRSIDDRLILGKWTTPIKGAYAQLLLTGSRGLFHVEREKGRGRRFTMYYLLTRE
jgi:hypothetical protein